MYALIIFAIVALRCDAFYYQSKMYLTLNQTSPCVLRMNATHTFGCTSPRSGTVGVLHLVHNDTDLSWVLKSSPMDSYVVGLSNKMFTRDNLLKLNASSKISGVLAMQDQNRKDIEPVSPEDQCPNRYSGLAAPPSRQNVCETPWNPIGSGMLQDHWNMPMFFTQENATLQELERCFNLNRPFDESQTSRSLCALQLSSHMFGAVDSRTCLRRNSGSFNLNPIRYCDVMGGENIYVPIVPLEKATGKRYIIVGARLDATSFFYQNAPASMAVATSLVTLLLAAKLLFARSRQDDVQKYDNNVLFVIFDGEAYDYIGSSRVVYDLQRNQFPSQEQPIRKEEIDLFIELSQIHKSPEIYYHGNSNITSYVNTLTSLMDKRNITLKPSTRSTVPPSSMQNFLLLNKNLPSFVLSSYNEKFDNPHYHSAFDDDYNIRFKYVPRNASVPLDGLQNYISNFAMSLSDFLYDKISKTKVPLVKMTPENDNGTVIRFSYETTKEEVNELLHCFVDTLACQYFPDLGLDIFPPSTDGSIQIMRPDYFVSVEASPTPLQIATKLLMMYFTNTNPSPTSEEKCTEINGNWIPKKNLCLKSLTNFTPAVSPAFVQDDYDMTSGQYATWTESIWQMNNVRMFMQPSRRYEVIFFVTGTLIFSFSFFLAFSIKRNAKELFDYPNLISATNM